MGQLLRFCRASAAIIGIFIICATETARASCDEWKILSETDSGLLAAWGTVRSGPDGALGSNRERYVGVASQRYTFNLLPIAVPKGDVAEVGRALSFAEYAFAHQRSDGGFDYFANPNPRGAVPDAAFFLYDFGHTLLLLGHSAWFQQSAEASQLRQRLSTLRSKTERTLSWLVSQSHVLDADNKAMNRVLVYASAYTLLGQALDREDGRQVGARFAEKALIMELPDGTMLENGGFDSAYQGVSLFVGRSLHCYFPENQAALRDRVKDGLERGAVRLIQSIDDRGRISTVANTRVRDDMHGEFDNGRAKSLDPRYAALGLQYAGAVGRNPKVQAAAELVAKFYFRKKSNP